MRLPSWINRLRADRGNAAVEFALTLPLLAFMAVGAMDFGMAFAMQTGYESAVRAGFEYAFTDSSDVAAIEKRVSANIDDPASLDAGYPAAAATCECSDGTAISCSATCGAGATPHRFIEITVQGNYRTLFDWPFINSSQPITYSARMRVG